MIDILRQSTLTANKDYKCFWCGLKILKGLKHSYEVQVFDGEFNAFRAHSCCAELFREYIQSDDYYRDYGMTPDDFISEMRERNGQHDTVTLSDELRNAKLAVGIIQTF